MKTTKKDIEILINAVIENDPVKVRELLERGVDPNQCLDGDKITPLHFAAQYNAERVVPYLLAAGADVYAMTPGDFATPQDIAKLHKHLEIARLLQSSRWAGSTAKN